MRYFGFLGRAAIRSLICSLVRIGTRGIKKSSEGLSHYFIASPQSLNLFFIVGYLLIEIMATGSGAAETVAGVKAVSSPVSDTEYIEIVPLN